MGRDCPDRQRGQSWRNDAPSGRPQARIGGEADADYEVCIFSRGVIMGETNANQTCSNSWQRSAAGLRPRASRQGLAILTERPSRGSEDPLEVRLLGATGIKIVINMMEATAAVVATADLPQVDLLPGRVIAVNGTLITTEVTVTTVAIRTTVAATAVGLPLERRHGIRLLLLLPELSLTEVTLVQVLIQGTRRCLLLLASEPPRHRLLTT